MDHDSRSVSSGILGTHTIAELRGSLLRALDTGNHGDDLRRILLQAASEARSNGVRAEQLLITLKQLWYSLPPITRHTEDDVQTRLLQQLISRCIQEYYSA